MSNIGQAFFPCPADASSLACLMSGCLFFLLPFLILLYISFVDMGNGIDPFKPIWDPR